MPREPKNQLQEETVAMRLNQLSGICGVAAALCLGAGVSMAQNNDGGGQARRGQGDLDPAQFQQRTMDNIKARLAFTNDAEWAAVQPLQ